MKHFIIAAKLGQDEALDKVKQGFQVELVSKEDYEAALCEHQAAVDATKSQQRDKAYAFNDDNVSSSLNGGVHNETLVPKDAVLRDDEGAYVYVLDGERALRRDVELGPELGDRFHVRRGIAARDRVIVSGNESLTPGGIVKVVDLPPPGPPTLPVSEAGTRPEAGAPNS